MRRKIYDTLLAWKREEADHNAVLIDGARRVGKSWIAEAFAKNEYKAYLLIDFTKTSRKIRELFDEYLDDLDTFFRLLQTYSNVRLVEHDSVIIFDEVQNFPRAREAIKHLVADGRYHYIETGSLISIRQNVKNILIPSEEIHVKMYPMDFEEFLWATGNEARWDAMRPFFDKRHSLGPLVHKTMMDLFRQYVIVGGMPQAVLRFIETNGDFMAVDRVKRGILTLYRDGIHKHAGSLAYKVEAVFDTLPGALSRHEKKFRPSDLAKDSRLRDYEDVLFWLKDAMVMNPCYNSTEPNVGLSLNLDRTTLKCYMGDTGLLVSHAFGENRNAVADIHRRILFDRIELNKGMIVENAVAQMLTATGRSLYFFSKYDKSNADERMEIDFLIAKSKIGRRKNISPIEVKSGTNYTTVSLDKFRRKYRTQTDTPYVLHSGDLKVKDGVVYLPLYMTPLL
ncbi:MAG: AAA family ATPase [Kiritimatiellae bacterium]|nr:AAA family ATPase [Kiritimatiellia bacterium]